MNQRFGVQKWENVTVGSRINTQEIMEEADWFDTEAKAVEFAKQIVAEKPEGCARVTVGLFDEGGEIAEDTYRFDMDV